VVVVFPMMTMMTMTTLCVVVVVVVVGIVVVAVVFGGWSQHYFDIMRLRAMWNVPMAYCDGI